MEIFHLKRILLCGINSRFNQTNPALRYLRNAITGLNMDYTVELKEYNINQMPSDVIRDIISQPPDYILFSIYIWNITFIRTIIPEIRKIIPKTHLICGGPEVSFGNTAPFYHKNFDYIIDGAGESAAAALFRGEVPSVSGGGAVVLRMEDYPVRLAELPFLYTPGELKSLNDKILYYESSRGCPYRCSYCLSSAQNGVEYRPLDLVTYELDRFLENGVKIVKFVDRTFNIDEERAFAIWHHIIKNHNAVTTFHFEVKGELLTKKLIELLSTAPAGAIQIEIGIQSSNPDTLREVRRTFDGECVSASLSMLSKSIHTHVDIIAGLPHENINSFAGTFNYAAALKPDMLQLGFLKVLGGTEMKRFADNNGGYIYSDYPPYEIWQTPDMSFDDISILKRIEELVDRYYNSGRYVSLFNTLAGRGGLFEFFKALAEWIESSEDKMRLYKPEDEGRFLYDYLLSLDDKIAVELFKYGFMSSFKVSFDNPYWMKRNYDKENHRRMLSDYLHSNPSKNKFIFSNFEILDIDPDSLNPGKTPVLFVFERNGVLRINGNSNPLKPKNIDF